MAGEIANRRNVNLASTRIKRKDSDKNRTQPPSTDTTLPITRLDTQICFKCGGEWDEAFSLTDMKLFTCLRYLSVSVRLSITSLLFPTAGIHRIPQAGARRYTHVDVRIWKVSGGEEGGLQIAHPNSKLRCGLSSSVRSATRFRSCQKPTVLRTVLLSFH
jgi:hypothetical protein